MSLNHVHLAASDVPALERFDASWFGFRRTAAHGDAVFLRDEAGFLIVAEPRPPAAPLPAWFHLGFCVDSANEVRERYERMKRAGVPMAKDLIDDEGEATVFYCLDPGGTKVEVSWYASDD